jgi:hypothetical protein
MQWFATWINENLLFCSLLSIKSFAISCWILCIIEVGTFTKLNQYTRILWSTTFTKTNLPPRESHRNVQLFILLTNFSINQFQSTILYPFGFKQKPKYFIPSSRLMNGMLNSEINLCLRLESMFCARKTDL